VRSNAEREAAGAFRNLLYVIRSAPIHIGTIGPIGEQPACAGEHRGTDRRQLMLDG
jgi:hypothetical protein